MKFMLRYGKKTAKSAIQYQQHPRLFKDIQAMKLLTLAVSTAVMAALSTSAFAQLPQSRILTVDLAQAIAQEAMAKCRAEGYHVTVLVVDALNSPKALLRDDGATASTTEVAKMKATSVMMFNRPSGPAQPPPPGQAAPPSNVPGTINAQGGVPIKVGEATIGAVGVSGAPGGDKDAACATAALAKVAEKLR
jgi:uncharacterized protein GlcG (DUF336 family)